MPCTIPRAASVRHHLFNRGNTPVITLIAFSSPDRQTVFLE